MLIKNYQGDWGIVTGQWTGFKRGVPGVKGKVALYLLLPVRIPICAPTHLLLVNLGGSKSYPKKHYFQLVKISTFTC